MTDLDIFAWIAAHLKKARRKHPAFIARLFPAGWDFAEQLSCARLMAERPDSTAWDLLIEEYMEAAQAATRGDYQAAADEAMDAAAVCIRLAVALAEKAHAKAGNN